nr:hypothetical protein [uncultured Sphingomonas sp.]
MKVALHNGTRLDPPPPVGSTQPKVRYLHVEQGDELGTASPTG